MEKVNGSLGFTLRKEDQSVLGHYVRALVREPALSDPRIRPGDKIVAVSFNLFSQVVKWTVRKLFQDTEPETASDLALSL